MDFFDVINVNANGLVNHTKLVYEEFKNHCNPNNPHLFLVAENCSSSDSNALSVGHPCGTNGEWDFTQCKIYSCVAGFAVDFESDKCIPITCDPRVDFSSSTTSSQSSPSSPSSTTSDHSSDVSGASFIQPLFVVVAFMSLLLL